MMKESVMIFSTAFARDSVLFSNDLAWMSEICTILYPSNDSGRLSNESSILLIVYMFRPINAPYAIAAGGMARLISPQVKTLAKLTLNARVEMPLTMTSSSNRMIHDMSVTPNMEMLSNDMVLSVDLCYANIVHLVKHFLEMSSYSVPERLWYGFGSKRLP